MKKLFLQLTFLLVFSATTAQIEKPPIYQGCENEELQNLENCFSNNLKSDILKQFQTPNIVERDNYKGQIRIVFIVSKEGDFEILYIHSIYTELENEVKRIFKNLPKIQPATYNGRTVDMRYVIPISIPINKNNTTETKEVIAQQQNIELKENIQDVIQKNNSLFPEFESELNIPFTHQYYDNITYHLNKGKNTHSAFKPYIYNEVKPHIDLNAQRTQLLKDKTSWTGRKLFNEHLALVKGKNYWFTVNPIFDLQIGKDNSDNKYTYNNTRALQIRGALGKKLSFSTSFYESQGRFADYINRWSKKEPIIGAYALVPGRGKAKKFKDGGFDYPVAEAYLSYTPNEFFNFQFGNGKNFIGDGYRSFFLSDVASPYPFLKISTQFWKIKYTNLWMWIDDVRPASSQDGTNFRKFVSMHHFSWNVTKNFNIGFFESVITNENNYNGLDVSFFNPLIFYRAVEFANGGDSSGNVQIGLNMKYKLNDNVFLYNQFLIDEMTVSRVFDGSGYWANKFALQLGAKYHNAFKIDNLMLQGEFNWARPYTFSHKIVALNPSHFNQPIGHLWEANFWEIIGIARYNKDRWFGSAKLILGKKGFDFDGSDISYGGDIFVSYTERNSDIGNNVTQGNKTNIFIADLQGGYVLNPATNLQLFAGFTYRGFSQQQQTYLNPIENTTWFTIGLKSDIFNWYFDF
ncbi:MAG: gliding motility protein RemB [Flavobacteriaceae bacterium]|nr:gliding motility protein RemB [Flavobacteriaceae bacterium]